MIHTLSKLFPVQAPNPVELTTLYLEESSRLSFINWGKVFLSLNASSFLVTKALIGVFFLQFTSTTYANESVVDSTLIINTKHGSIAGSFISAKTNGIPTIAILVSAPKGNNRNISNNGGIAINFKALAEKLSLCGISTFRFDNRGVEQSSGDNKSATLYTHADDVKSICRFFKNNKKFKKFRIGLIGHSEGAASSEIVAASGNEISFLILLSAQGYAGWDFFKYQFQQYYKNRGLSFNLPLLADSLYKQNALLQGQLSKILDRYNNYSKIRSELRQIIDRKVGESPDSSMELERLYSEWQTSQQLALRKFNPQLYLSKIKCPVLALNGSRDDSVEGIKNLDQIMMAMKASGNLRITTKLLPNVNHYYRTLRNEEVWNLLDKKELFSPLALQTICDWFGTIHLDED